MLEVSSRWSSKEILGVVCLAVSPGNTTVHPISLTSPKPLLDDSQHFQNLQTRADVNENVFRADQHVPSC